MRQRPTLCFRWGGVLEAEGNVGLGRLGVKEKIPADMLAAWHDSASMLGAKGPPRPSLLRHIARDPRVAFWPDLNHQLAGRSVFA